MLVENDVFRLWGQLREDVRVPSIANQQPTLFTIRGKDFLSCTKAEMANSAWRVRGAKIGKSGRKPIFRYTIFIPAPRARVKTLAMGETTCRMFEISIPARSKIPPLDPKSF